MSDPDRAPLWDAAFGARPDRDLPGDRATPGDAWLAAVALGGRGYYAAAAARLRVLINGSDPVLAALAAAALASHRRQLGGHAAARALDAAGLHRLAAAGVLGARGIDRDHPDIAGPAGMDAKAARSDVLLGLAADAVGLGRTAEARSLLATESASPDAGWRAEIRRGWVAAEIELGAGRIESALAPARAAAAAAGRSTSVRHRTKSALVLGATLAAAGERAQAREMITGALADAIASGLRPLVWPCAIVRADLAPESAAADRALAAETLHCVLRHSDPGVRLLAAASPWVPTWLFAAAPIR
ncbi:hypothetical protein [Actinokineospora sp.]|uniref:hypothetical protein n=1 Tax=Actinokineospora sp. TaxID=1872133 RepID=UPI004038025E